MLTVEEKIQQALSNGVVLFDEQGELCHMNSVAEKMLLLDACNREFITELTNKVRIMSSTRRVVPSVTKMRSDAHGCEIICTVKRVLGDRYRAVLKPGAEISMAIA